MRPSAVKGGTSWTWAQMRRGTVASTRGGASADARSTLEALTCKAAIGCAMATGAVAAKSCTGESPCCESRCPPSWLANSMQPWQRSPEEIDVEPSGSRGSAEQQHSLVPQHPSSAAAQTQTCSATGMSSPGSSKRMSSARISMGVRSVGAYHAPYARHCRRLPDTWADTAVCKSRPSPETISAQGLDHSC